MNIILTTDFTPASRIANEFAINLLSKDDDRNLNFLLVHAFHVLSPYTNTPYTPVMVNDEVHVKLQERLDEEVRYLSEFAPGIKGKLEKGSVGEVIDKIEEEANPDLIVAATQEKDFLERLAVGSNSSELAKNSRTSVLIIPKEYGTIIPQKIAFGSDYKTLEITRESLHLLKNLVKDHKGVLQVFHVYEEGEEVELISHMEKTLKHHYLDRVKHEFHPIVNKNIYEGIANFIEKEKPDMVAVIPRDKGFLQEIFHPSVTKKMTHHVKVPLLVLR